MKNQGLGDKENINFKEKPMIICKTLQMLMKSNVPWKKKHFLEKTNSTKAPNLLKHVCLFKNFKSNWKARFPAQAITIPFKIH